MKRTKTFCFPRKPCNSLGVCDGHIANTVGLWFKGNAHQRCSRLPNEWESGSRFVHLDWLKQKANYLPRSAATVYYSSILCESPRLLWILMGNREKKSCFWSRTRILPVVSLKLENRNIIDCDYRPPPIPMSGFRRSTLLKLWARSLKMVGCQLGCQLGWQTEGSSE